MDKIKFRVVRDVGSTIDVTIQFLRQNFSIISKSIFFIGIPFLLVGALLYSGIYIIQNSFLEEGEVIYFLGLFVSVVLVVLYFFCIFPIVYEYMYLYYERDDFERISVDDVRKRVRSRFSSYIGNTFLISLLLGGIYSLGIGTVFLFMFNIAMGIGAVFLFLCLLAYVCVGLSFVYAVNLFEGVSFGVCLNRCFYLLKGHFLTTLGLYVSAYFIGVSIGFIPSSLLPALFEFLGVLFDFRYGEIILILFGFLYSLVLLVVVSVTLTASLFRYFSLVESKEAMGVYEDIGRIGVVD